MKNLYNSENYLAMNFKFTPNIVKYYKIKISKLFNHIPKIFEKLNALIFYVYIFFL